VGEKDGIDRWEIGKGEGWSRAIDEGCGADREAGSGRGEVGVCENIYVVD